MADVVTAITTMATTVQTNALSVITNVLPVMATVTGAIIVANLGRKIVVKFAK